MQAGTGASGGGHCTDLVRQFDRERFLASLFAPASDRPALHALYAYNVEIARVRGAVREPLAGEIRLQWWRDALAGTAAGDAAANPVAAALLATVRARQLPVAPLATMSEARIFDLYDDPMPSLTDLEGYAGETRSALVQLAALVLAGSDDPGSATAAGHAGVAQTVVAILEAFPHHRARGQVYLPGDLLARHGLTAEDVRGGEGGAPLAAALGELAGHGRHHFERAWRHLPSVLPAARPAFLPALALEGRLARLARQAPDDRRPRPFADVRFQFALWRAARRLARLPRA